MRHALFLAFAVYVSLVALCLIIDRVRGDKVPTTRLYYSRTLWAFIACMLILCPILLVMGDHYNGRRSEHDPRNILAAAAQIVWFKTHNSRFYIWLDDWGRHR